MAFDNPNMIRQDQPMFDSEKRKAWKAVAMFRGEDGRTGASIMLRPVESDYVAVDGSGREGIVMNISEDFGQLSEYVRYVLQQNRVSPRARDYVDNLMYRADVHGTEVRSLTGNQKLTERELRTSKETLLDYIAELEAMLPQHADAKS